MIALTYVTLFVSFTIGVSVGAVTTMVVLHWINTRSKK